MKTQNWSWLQDTIDGVRNNWAGECAGNWIEIAEELLHENDRLKLDIKELEESMGEDWFS